MTHVPALVTRALTRLWVVALVALAILATPRLAAAQIDVGSSRPKRPPTLDIFAQPILGEGSLQPNVWAEVLVRFHNRGERAISGYVAVLNENTSYRSQDTSVSRAPFSVPPEAWITLRLPIMVSEADDPTVRVFDDEDVWIFEQRLARNHLPHLALLNVAQVSPLVVKLGGTPVPNRFNVWEGGLHSYRSSLPELRVLTPVYDGATGDPILPQRAAGYIRMDAVMIRSDTLARLPAGELEALAGFVLGGGTLAVVVTRPEDLRGEPLTALIGGAAAETQVTPAMLDNLPAMALPPAPQHGTYVFVPSNEPGDLQLTAYAGGNLAQTIHGSSATYGLGQVHLLPFDPNREPAISSPFALTRLTDMVRLASERKATVLYPPGGEDMVVTGIRRELDPNESSHWAIILVALLLCAYAIVAGPVNYGRWRERGRPLVALAGLAVSSGITFAAIVVISIAAKGCTGRVRHLTFVEAGAGMPVGVARRYRGYFVPSAREIDIRTRSASSVIQRAKIDWSDQPSNQIVNDKNGLRLQSVALRPWETEVIREDDYASLGGGVAMLRLSDSETEIVNRTGRTLRGVIVHQPGVGVGYVERLEPNDRISTAKLSFVPGVARAVNVAGFGYYEADLYALTRRLNDASDRLGSVWRAAGESMSSRAWFLEDVPVLLAQLDGGEGITRDAGIDVDRSRVLIRVVGYGGAP